MTGSSSAAGDRTRVLARDQHVDWVVVDGEAVLFDRRTRVFHHLNPSAAEVWSALDGLATVDQVIDRVARRHSGAVEAVMRDVVRMAAQFDELGVVRAVPAESRQPREGTS
jgi:hypothetical protein